MNRRKLLCAMLTVPGLAVLPACSTLAPPPDLKAPDITLNDISIGRFDLKEMLFELKVDLKNPNAVALPLSGLKLDLALLGVPVAVGHGPAGGFTVPANGTSTVPIQISVPFGKITESMRALRLNSTGEQLYELKGSAAWGPLGLPLRFERKGNTRDLLAKFLPQAR